MPVLEGTQRSPLQVMNMTKHPSNECSASRFLSMVAAFFRVAHPLSRLCVSLLLTLFSLSWWKSRCALQEIALLGLRPARACERSSSRSSELMCLLILFSVFFSWTKESAPASLASTQPPQPLAVNSLRSCRETTRYLLLFIAQERTSSPFHNIAYMIPALRLVA
jgi:hypothetical protein